MSIYVYTLIDPVTQAILHAGASHRPTEIYQEHLDGECADTAEFIDDLLARGRIPVMKIMGEYQTWKAARLAQDQANAARSVSTRASRPLPAAPFTASEPWKQAGFASFM
ncbi:MAG: hypothetical protein ACRCTD_06645 [Beijerinckiaceae bacterium]